MNKKSFDKWLEEVRKLGWKPGLSRVKELLNRFDNPQNKLQIIHISGTNGKGSTATLLNNILIEGGYKTGQFSTPSILGFEDMFRIDNQGIDEDRLYALVDEIKEVINEMIEDGFEHPTEYEIIAAIMYIYFYRAHVDYAVVEVAMGGENDCTNVMEHSILSIMTPISMDHSGFLGDTLEKIAREKSGIIKHNSVFITHPQEKEVMKVLHNVCEEKNTVLHTFDEEPVVSFKNMVMTFSYDGLEIRSQLLGQHQASNIVHVIEAIRNLNIRGYTNINGSTLIEAIYKTKFPGRFEKIDSVILDGAHNNASLIALRDTLESLDLYNLTGVIGVLKDKNIVEGLTALKAHFKELYVTEPLSDRRLEKEVLAQQLLDLDYRVEMMGTINEVVNELKDSAYLAFGSFYMISEIRKEMMRLKEGS